MLFFYCLSLVYFIYGCGQINRFNYNPDSDMGSNWSHDTMLEIPLAQSNKLIAYAATQGSCELIQALLDSEVYLDELYAIIHPESCCYCHDHIIPCLLIKYSPPDQIGNNLVHNGIKNNGILFIKEFFEPDTRKPLVHLCKELYIYLTQKNCSGSLPLDFVSQNNILGIFRIIFERFYSLQISGFDPKAYLDKIFTVTNNHGLNVIDMATAYGHSDLLKEVFEESINYNYNIEKYILYNSIKVGEVEINKNSGNTEKIKDAVQLIKGYIKDYIDNPNSLSIESSQQLNLDEFIPIAGQYNISDKRCADNEQKQDYSTKSQRTEQIYICKWGTCKETFNNQALFYNHVKEKHRIEHYELICRWDRCGKQGSVQLTVSVSG
ncbi:hypothetical protein [Cardinium endosymbiont of Sogatella furcifera]|uniref:hypothetical protein n=1 Tax=Cardinium endosymbiont of Sogatella furcifera TaxID=650378 RepID=UPI0013B3E1E3|nr:hypothetical protein [Cardinium endosymbiont of Sogatella furcifera]